MNKVILIGNLTRDPEVRYAPSTQTAVCRFSLAINTGYGDNQRTDYPSIVVFGKQAENCEKYLRKGSKVAVEGRIQTGSYEKDGRKVYTTDVISNSVEFLSTNRNAEASGMTSNDGMGIPAGFSESYDDDIPF